MQNNILNYIYKNVWLLFLLLFSVLPLTPLLSDGMFIAHDAQDHVARIANFYQNLKEGVLIPRWAANLNWGYGHPILMFLYPLPSYVASLFISLGFSLVTSTKLVFAVGYITSGITMFIWIRKLWGDKAGFIGAIFYIYAPYRFVDLYVRGAIGENFFFIFPPLVCYFLTKLIERPKTSYISWTALAIAGMILSHNALTIMFLPFIACYAVVLILQRKKKKGAFFYSIFSCILGFGLSAFFLFPALVEGKYTLRDIVTKNELFNRFETLGRLLYSSWNYGGSGQFSVGIGIFHWIAVAISTIFIAPLLIRFKKKSNFNSRDLLVVVTSLLFFWIAILCILPLSKPIYELLTILQKFQFPWRFLSLTVFTSSVVAGFVASRIEGKYKTVLIVSFSVVLILSTISFWKPVGFFQKPESFYTEIYDATTDTGESAPIWSVRFMEKRPVAKAQIVEGEANIKYLERTSVKHEYAIDSIGSEIRFLENTLYFPGWKVFVDSNEVPVNDILFMDPTYRGLINFYINSPGSHKIEIKFVETKLREISNFITLASCIILIGLFINVKKRI